MKRLIVTLLMMTPFMLCAQHNGEQQSREEFWKEIESWKVAYFTHELCITSEEATQFWPIYNSMTEQIIGLDWQKRSLRHSIKEMEAQKKTVDYMEVFRKMMELDQKRFEVRQKSYEKMVEIMPVSKLLKLDDVEERFRQKLFNYLRKRTHNSQPSGDPNSKK